MNSTLFSNTNIQYLLASASPRRKQLLEQIGLPFTVVPSDKEEVVKETLPGSVVDTLSRQKSMDIAKQLANHQLSDELCGKDSIIIGADTVVANGRQILGKPKNRDDAYHMLSTLSGHSHQVYTGVTFCYVKNSEIPYHHTFHVKTNVFMKPANSKLINYYLDTDEPYDKAGAYGIQGLGALLVDHIEGDYNNVVGLPISKLYDELTKFISKHHI